MKIVHISAFYSLENNYGASTRFKNLMDELANDKENQHIIIAPNYIDKRFSVLPLKDNYRLLKIIQIWNYLIACKPEIVVSDFLPTIFLRKSKLIYIIHDVQQLRGYMCHIIIIIIIIIWIYNAPNTRFLSAMMIT